MSQKQINIAIDGYSSCGKSTVAKLLAKRVGYIYIDSGAMYRAITYFALQRGIIKDKSIYKPSLLKALPSLHIRFKNNEKGQVQTYLNGENIEKEIRTMHVSAHVSQVSAIKEVREKLVALQQDMGKEKGVVMDGRDIGTTVFPDAEIKFFLVSDLDLRVERRRAELQAKGIQVTSKEVEDNLRKRDYIDSNREESPLTKAKDAIEIDNSEVSLEVLVEQLHQMICDKVNELCVKC